MGENGQNIKGKLLLHPPGDVRTAKAISNFLANKVFRKPVEKVAPLVNAAMKKNSPLKISGAIEKERATIIISHIRKLGGRAEFKDGREGQAPVSGLAGGQAPAPQRPSEPKPGHPAFDDGLSVLGSLARFFEKNKSPVVFAILAGMFFLLGGPARVGMTLPGLQTFSKPKAAAVQNAGKGASKPARRGGTDYYLYPGKDPLEEFDFRYSIYFDPRFSGGLEEAVRLYAALFGPQPDTPINVKTISAQETIDTFKLTIKAEAGNNKWRHEVVLSSDHDKARENFMILSGALRDFANSSPSLAMPPDKIKQKPWPGLDAAKKEAITFDVNKIMGVLSHIPVDPVEGVDPEALRFAGEALSIMAFLKSPGYSNQLETFLSTKAIGVMLLASTLDSGQGGENSLSLAYMFLGMRYRAAALEEFQRQGGKLRDLGLLLGMYAKADMKGLKNVYSQPSIGRRAAGYLYARLLLEDRRLSALSLHVGDLLSNHPDFLTPWELFMSRMLVDDTSNNYISFLNTVAKTNIRMIEKFVSGEPFENFAGYDPENSKKWLTELLYTREEFDGAFEALGRSGRRAGIVTPSFLEQYSSLDVQNAHHLAFNYLTQAKSSINESDYVMRSLEEVFPDSDSITYMRIKTAYYTADYERVIAMGTKVNRNMVDESMLYLLLQIEKLKSSHEEDISNAQINLLRLRKKNPAHDEGLNVLGTFYDAFFNKPAALEYWKRAIKVNPFISKHYAWYVLEGGDANVLFNEKFPMDNSYGRHLTWAQWLMDSGKPGQAEEVLKKAISMAPEESGAYAMLGEMYANREDYAKAMKVWSQWLNLRIDTFSQVGFINKIARTLLDKNQHQVAYDLASISAQSGQAEAGLLKAEAAEGLGMYEEAEKLINDVIRRYPYGRVSVYLALFHLRQGDFESAATTLRKNKDRGEFMFYKHDVVDIFAKNNQAGSAFNFVSRVEDREDGVRMSWMFGEALMKKGFHKEAADVFRPWISKSAYDNAQPYTFAMLYFKAMREGGLATDQQILDEIWGLIQDDPKVREFFGLILVMNGMYDQGYMALKRLMVENPAQRDLRLFIIAYAWLGGSQDPRQAKWILEAAANVEQPWTADLVMYVLGEMDENEIRRLADDRDKAADLHYALGLMSRKKGDVQTATKHFLICLDTMSEKNLGYMFGRFELKRMHEKKENI